MDLYCDEGNDDTMISMETVTLDTEFDDTMNLVVPVSPNVESDDILNPAIAVTCQSESKVSCPAAGALDNVEKESVAPYAESNLGTSTNLAVTFESESKVPCPVAGALDDVEKESVAPYAESNLGTSTNLAVTFESELKTLCPADSGVDFSKKESVLPNVKSNNAATCRLESKVQYSVDGAKNCSMKERFGFFFLNKLCSDVHFVVGREPNVREVPAHKVVLAAGCLVFKEMIRENRLVSELPHFDPDAFLALLRYLYMDEIVLTPDLVVFVLNLAKHYEIPALVNACTLFFAENLKPQNVLTLLSQAAKFNEEDLIDLCLAVIDENTLNVVESDGFCDLNVDMLCLILERDTLNIGEVELLEAVVRWAEAESKRRNVPQKSLLERPLSCIRFPLMSAYDFARKVAHRELLPDKETILMFKYYSRVADPPSAFSKTPRTGSCRQLAIRELSSEDSVQVSCFDGPTTSSAICNLPSENSARHETSKSSKKGTSSTLCEASDGSNYNVSCSLTGEGRAEITTQKRSRRKRKSTQFENFQVPTNKRVSRSLSGDGSAEEKAPKSSSRQSKVTLCEGIEVASNKRVSSSLSQDRNATNQTPKSSKLKTKSTPSEDTEIASKKRVSRSLYRGRKARGKTPKSSEHKNKTTPYEDSDVATNESETYSISSHESAQQKPPTDSKRKTRSASCEDIVAKRFIKTDSVPHSEEISGQEIPKSSKRTTRNSLCEGFIVKRFTETKTDWPYLGGADAIGFMSDHELNLKGIGLYGSKTMRSYTITVAVMNAETKEVLLQISKLHKCDGSTEILEFLFEKPVRITALTTFIVKAWIKGQPSLYGSGGAKELTVNLTDGRKVTIWFSTVEDKSPCYRSHVEKGQIPELLF